MEKDRILNLVAKRLSGEASSREFYELQNLLQKSIGISDTHKVLLHLYNIQSLVKSADALHVQKLREMETPLKPSKATVLTKAARKFTGYNYVRYHFFNRNRLFRIYCALTLRQLKRILY